MWQAASRLRPTYASSRLLARAASFGGRQQTPSIAVPSTRSASTAGTGTTDGASPPRPPSTLPPIPVSAARSAHGVQQQASSIAVPSALSALSALSAPVTGSGTAPPSVPPVPPSTLPLAPVLNGSVDAADVDDDASPGAPRDDLTPARVVAELERHIVGQGTAKRAMAIALRNRWRRLRLTSDLRDEVVPKNVLLVGPTGVGKTEIARRLSKLVDAPFIKVEATKFTEVGFHGRDVDQIIRDLLENAIGLVRARQRRGLVRRIERIVEERVLDELVGKDEEGKAGEGKREELRVLLRNGALDQQMIEVEEPVRARAGPSVLQVDMASERMADIFSGMNPRMFTLRGTQKRRVRVEEARALIEEAESEKLLSDESVMKEAIAATESSGIVVLDELDKVCSPGGARGSSADASAEGVQRDLLPLIEGTTVSTKHGNVRTDHILFVAAGAFHSCKPSDLMAELLGRLPIKGMFSQRLCARSLSPFVLL